MNIIKSDKPSINTNEAQAQLDEISGIMNNVFEDNNWRFDCQQGHVINIDFHDLLNMEIKYPDWHISKAYDWVYITKVSWLLLASKTTPSVYQARLNGLKLFWASLAYHHSSQLTLENYSDVLSFILMNNTWLGKHISSPKIKSYTSFNFGFQIADWKYIFSEMGLDFISKSVTKSKVYNNLKRLIPELTNDDISYTDWISGGSLDLLTLDHGRYYIEHCSSFYEKHYPLAFALSSIYESAQELANSTKFALLTVKQFLSFILEGDKPEDVKHRFPNSSLKSIEIIYDFTILKFEEIYKQSRYEALLLDETTVKSIASACNLMITHENIDRLKIIIWDWINREDRPETVRLLNECQPRILWKDLEKQLCIIKAQSYQKPANIPSEKEYLEIGLTKSEFRNSSSKYYRQLIRLVNAAGLSNIIALTGWRQSEYGFPISSVNRFKNNDKLDQYAFPWRYQVDWYVYKTNGQIRELREITFSIYLLVERLNNILAVDKNQPCLYKITDKNTIPEKSGIVVGKSVRLLWGNFVNHYSPFVEIDNHNSFIVLQSALDAGKPLTSKEQLQLEGLLKLRPAKDWIGLSIDINLKDTWKKVRKDWPRIELFFMNSNRNDKKNWLLKYTEGTLRADWIKLLDTHLSNDIKIWIHSLPKYQLYSVNATRSVTSYLTENTIYPSPHAFRHMWAESVYRRFDGDAGWMIRSQFKHISRTMWLAYIRDKDNRRMHETVKTKVISSLVNNYLLHKGELYAGQLDTWLRRVLKKTYILTPKEQIQYAENLTTGEIENIKANPWGYCLLKRRTRSKAKCTEMGEPMRHNASPDLCLGCAHSLMQTENVEWSLFHASSHIEALKNPIVPALFKKTSYKLIKNVIKHVKKMNPQHEALPELIEVLDIYKVSVTN